MTKERLAIIKIVKPYMNKSVKKGCILEMVDGKIEYVEGFFEYGGDYIDDIYLLKTDVKKGFKLGDNIVDIYLLKTDVKKGFKLGDNIVEDIIGHYGLSAILKYLYANDYLINCDSNNNILIQTYDITGSYIDEQYEIPNEEPYLYTEKQERDLLKLLTKIEGLR